MHNDDMYNTSIDGTNYSRILFHKVKWFLVNADITELKNDWREEITQFIIDGYSSGEFEVECNGEMDCLKWEVMTVWNGQN
jgi:hypothetical protein